MKQIFIKKEGHPRLLLFFAGWGVDERLFDAPVCEGYDCLVCYDYRTLDFDVSLLSGYQTIRAAAWSMGVWVIRHVLAEYPIACDRILAWNGTPYPIDDRRGIPAAVYQGTLAGFSEAVLAKFRRRMCGTAAEWQAFMSREPQRPWTELRDELEALERFVSTHPDLAGLKCDKAVIGTADRIFPPANQEEAWQGTPVERVPSAHYDSALLARLLGEEEIWTKP